VFGRYSLLYAVFAVCYVTTVVLLLMQQLRWTGYLRSAARVAHLAVIGVTAFVVVISLMQPGRLIGVSSRIPAQEDVLLALAAALLTAIGATIWSRLRAAGPDNQRTAQSPLSLTAFLVIAALIIWIGSILYHQAYAPLWVAIIEELRFGAWLGVTLILAIALGVRIVMLPPAQYLGAEAARAMKGTAAFLLAGFLAYCATFFIFAAYIFTGYRFRLTPFTVFHTDALVAVAFIAIIGLGLHALRSIKATHARGSPPSGQAVLAGGNGFVAVGSFALALLMSAYWFGTQAAYVRMLPPTHYSLLDVLSARYKGATTITNTYAAPLAWATGNWSYLHSGAMSAVLQKDGSRYVVIPDGTYMWFADKRSNPEYRWPDYYVCVSNQAPMNAVHIVSSPMRGDAPTFGCTEDFLVQMTTRQAGQICPPVKLADMDTDGPKTVGFARWAIVKLEWAEADSGCRDLVSSVSIRPVLQ
jgi:hypothetical protein